METKGLCSIPCRSGFIHLLLLYVAVPYRNPLAALELYIPAATLTITMLDSPQGQGV